MLKIRSKVILAVCEEPLTENNWDRYNLIGGKADDVVYLNIAPMLKRDFSHEESCLVLKKTTNVNSVGEYECFVKDLSLECNELHIIHLNLYQSKLKEVYEISRRYAKTLTFYWPYPPYVPLSLKDRFHRKLSAMRGMFKGESPIFDYYLCPSIRSAGYFLGNYSDTIDTVAFDVNLSVSSNRLIVEDAIIYIDQILEGHLDYNRFINVGKSQGVCLQSSYDRLIAEFKKNPEKIIFCPHPRSSSERVAVMRRMGVKVMQLREIKPFNSLLLFHTSSSLHLMAYLSISKNNRFIGLRPPHSSFARPCERMSSYYGIKVIDIDDFDINSLRVCGKRYLASDKQLQKARKYLFATDKTIYSSFDPYLQRIGFV
ncbi:hypothetical protein [Chlorobium phaeovibrioides]|uniref:hypothetical protein n=1 Tax=Chlorobium phaeovibrioides TaxID=1094 RepID=UPI0012314592|nr:hypothetical protein [Chlorobium phaeovibrioides]QEQ57237.1 hypothetical protein FNV82_06400 [Chlorobium phaeovibrioides]